MNPSHSLSCGPTVCLRAEGQVLLPVCIHSPGGSPPTPQTSPGLPYPQRALVSRPQLQALYRAQGPGCAAISPLSSRELGTRSLGVGVCAPGRGRIPRRRPPPPPSGRTPGPRRRAGGGAAEAELRQTWPRRGGGTRAPARQHRRSPSLPPSGQPAGIPSEPGRSCGGRQTGCKS